MGAYRTLPGPRCCYGKLRLTPEEAAARFDRYTDPNTSIYVCNECGGWLHFGHEPTRMQKATHHAIATYRANRRREMVKQYRAAADALTYFKETQYLASIKRQQNKLRKPAWMNDSRT